MRIVFFNELDSYGIANNLDVESIIKGVCLDQELVKAIIILLLVMVDIACQKIQNNY